MSILTVGNLAGAVRRSDRVVTPLWAACLTIVSLAACADAATAPLKEEPAPREVVTPPCADPSPLNGKPNPLREGYIVNFTRGVDAVLESQRLSTKYQLTPTTVFLFAPGGFAATITPQKVATLRCEPTVASVDHDMLFTIATGSHP